MKELPVEFNAVLGALLPAIGGGWSLMSIGLFSYLTEVTEEKDRVFRFGIMYQIFPVVSICTLPFAGILYQKLGYISKWNFNNFKVFKNNNEPIEPINPFQFRSASILPLKFRSKEHF